MRDQTIIGLINKAKQEMNMRVGLLDLIAKEALYQTSAFLSLIISIPCIGYLFKKIMNKRISKLKGIIEKSSGIGQKQDANKLLEVQRRRRQRIDYKILMQLRRKCRIIWWFLKKLN